MTPTHAQQLELLAEFLRELKAHAHRFRWHVDEFGQIRAEHPDYAWPICPITALAMIDTGRPFRAPQVHDAAEAIGLESVSLAIVQATDHRHAANRLRPKILAAVELPAE